MNFQLFLFEIIFWIIVHFCFRNFFIPVIFKSYQFYATLNSEEKKELPTRVVASIHGVFISFLCIFSLLTEFSNSKKIEDLLFATPPIANFIIHTVSTFYITDFLQEFFIFNSEKKDKSTNIKNLTKSKNSYRKSWQIYLHHFGTITPLVVVLLYSQLYYFSLFCALIETTTLFTNLHWILSKAKMRESSIFLFNLFLSFISYLLCRLINLPLLFWKAFILWPIISKQVSFVVVFVTMISTFIILCMSAYWFLALIRLFSHFSLIKIKQK